MKTRTILLTLVAALALAATAAAKPARYYVPKHGARCKAHYVHRTVRVAERRHGNLVRRHHRIVTVKQARCVYVAPKKKAPVIPPAPTPPTTAPTPAPPAAPAPAAAPPVAHAGIDPAYTQDPADPLHVTWTYSATGDGNPLPTGTLSLTVFQHGQVGQAGGCTMNVDATTTGGTCTVELPAYGAFDVTVSYAGASSTVAPSSSTDTETIEPMPVTRAMRWGTDVPTASPTVSALVIGQTASVTVTAQNYEGATSLAVSDNLGDSCTAAISDSQATCQMPVTGTPSTFQIQYPGGTSTASAQPVAPNGTQQVTTTWPADVVAVNRPDVTVQQATVQECGGQQQNGPAWYYNGANVGCGPNPGAAVVSGQWPNPVTVATGQWVVFNAAAIGSLASDHYPAGYLTFTVTGPDAPTLAYDEDYGSTPPGGHDSAASQDCSQVQNAAWPQQAVGGCMFEFGTPGEYTLRVDFHSQTSDYGDSQQAYTETIEVQ